MSKTTKTSDPLAWMRKHLSNVPPTAIAAFERANSDRAAGRAKTPRKDARMIPLPPAPPKPRAVKTRDEAQASLLAPSVAAHVRAGLKNFKTARAAQDALMTLREALARLNGDRDSDAALYLKARGLRPMSIATTTSPTGGGYLVPDAVVGAVQLRLMEVGALRQLATVIPVVNGQASVPVLTTQPTVYYAGETEAVTDSTPAFGALNIEVKKRGVLLKISNELMNDSAFSVLDLFVGTAANALGSVEDAELVNGDATSTYGGEVGLLASLGTAGVYAPSNGTGKSVWTGFVAADFAALVAKLPEQYCHPDNAWLCSTPFFAIMCAAVPAAVSWNAEGQPLFWGKRVVLCEKMPRTTATSQVSALYGDFGNAVTLADRGLTFATSDVAPGAFEQDYTIMRALSRYDLVVSNLGDGSAAGAVVGLKTSAS